MSHKHVLGVLESTVFRIHITVNCNFSDMLIRNCLYDLFFTLIESFIHMTTHALCIRVVEFKYMVK